MRLASALPTQSHVQRRGASMPVRASGQPRCHVAPCHASRPPWRWTARPLQGPRGQRQAVAPWGPPPPARAGHRAGWHGGQRTVQALPKPRRPPRTRSLASWRRAPLPVTPGVCVATPGPAGSLAPPALAGAGGDASRRSPTPPRAGGKARGPWTEGAHTSDGGRLDRPCVDAARSAALSRAAVATAPGAVSDVEA